jgi:hypothetical protein
MPSTAAPFLGRGRGGRLCGYNKRIRDSEPYPLVQDLPEQPTQTMRDVPDGLFVSQARQQTPEHHVEYAPHETQESMRHDSLQIAIV